MAYSRIWIHAVWSTKARQPLLTNGYRELVCQHIIENSKIKGFYIDELNGYHEHLHCLMCLKSDLSISKQMQLIKGESSYWANKQGVFQKKFDWADEYFASSVSESRLIWIRNYIRNQEMHHRKISFAEEYNNFLSKFKFVSG